MKLLRKIIIKILEDHVAPLTNRDITEIIVDNNMFNFPDNKKSPPIKYIGFETRRLFKNGIISRENNKDGQRQTCLYVAKNLGQGIDDYKLEYNYRKNKKENKKVVMGIVVPSTAPLAVVIEDDLKEQVEMVVRDMVEKVHQDLDKTIGPEPDMFMDEIKVLEEKVIEEMKETEDEEKETSIYIEDNCWENIKSFLVDKEGFILDGVRFKGLGIINSCLTCERENVVGRYMTCMGGDEYFCRDCICEKKHIVRITDEMFFVRHEDDYLIDGSYYDLDFDKISIINRHIIGFNHLNLEKMTKKDLYDILKYYFQKRCSKSLKKSIVLGLIKSEIEKTKQMTYHECKHLIYN